MGKAVSSKGHAGFGPASLAGAIGTEFDRGQAAASAPYLPKKTQLPARHFDGANGESNGVPVKRGIAWRLPQSAERAPDRRILESRVRVVRSESPAHAARAHRSQFVRDPQHSTACDGDVVTRERRPSRIKRPAPHQPMQPGTSNRATVAGQRPLSCRELRKQLGFAGHERSPSAEIAPVSPAPAPAGKGTTFREAGAPLGSVAGMITVKPGREIQLLSKSHADADERLPISRMLLFSEQVGKFSALSDEGARMIASMLRRGTNGPE